MATNNDALIDQLFTAVKGYLARRVDGLSDQMKALNQRLDGLPPLDKIKGDAGDQGPAGERGADGAAGRDGQDGKDGAPGVKGDAGEVGPAGPAGPKGDPGEPGQNGSAGDRGEKGMDGADGRDGEPGRDAPHVDVLDGIDNAKRYQRGTWATWRGGVIRSFRATDPLAEGVEIEKAGWHVVMQGLHDAKLELSDDGRTVHMGLQMTGGAVIEKRLAVPAMIYRGVWKDGDGYEKGDSATRDGSVWVLMTEKQAGKPGDADSGWQLAVKRGTHGRDGIRGEKGDRGAEGRASQDLARMSPRGPV